VSVNNGNPYSITTGRDDNGDGVINDRPRGMRRLSRIGPTYRGVGFNNLQSISNWAQQEQRIQLNVFANMSNAFNTVNLGTPSGVMTSPFFGKSTSASNPREIEVGMRFQF
jgi:hypothetical protein